MDDAELPGITVFVIVYFGSTETEPIVVPDVSNMTIADAESKLKELGFIINEEYEEYEEYADLDENINGDDSITAWENEENAPEEVTRNIIVRNIVAFGVCVLVCAVIFLIWNR